MPVYSLSLHDAQAVVDAYNGDCAPRQCVDSIEITSREDSYSEFVIRIQEHASLKILCTSVEILNAQSAVLKLIQSSTPDAPIPSVLKEDTSLTVLRTPYALLSHPIGTPLRDLRPQLSPQALGHIDLQLGTHIRRLHGIENDWFGLPSDPKEWGECYSWQECFSLLVETALTEAEDTGLSALLPVGHGVEDIRRCLGRAIGFFLFDDVEVPVLVWDPSLAFDASVFVSSPEPENGDAMAITGLVGWAHAIWGDALMEGAFRDPPDTFVEAYGGSPILFARQRTKRMWYTLYAALLALLQSKEGKGEPAAVAGGWDRERVLKILVDTVDALKSAPCY